MAMTNGTLLQVLNRRTDGGWYVRVKPTGEEGWALNGKGNQAWIVCCKTVSASAEDASAEPLHAGVCTGILISGASSIRHPQLDVKVDLNPEDWVVKEQNGHHCIIDSATTNREMIEGCRDGGDCEVHGTFTQDSSDGVYSGFRKIDSVKPLPN
jgi:uncharacterized NAD-dependent epimerase/dehydratase family protein